MGKKGYGSVYGHPQRTVYEYIKLIKSEKVKPRILVIDGGDGQHILPFVRKECYVTCYENNEIMLSGGKLDNFTIVGLKTKLKQFSCEKYCTIVNKNFYKEKVDTKYDFVYVYRSLHKPENQDMDFKRKLRKIMSAVKDGGYVYVFYHLALKDKDYINYKKSSYVRVDEIKQYVSDDFKIINLIEHERETKHLSHPYNNVNHVHKVGHLFAKKIYKRRKHTYTFKIKNANT